MTASDWTDLAPPFDPRRVARYFDLGLWSERTIGAEFSAMAATRAGELAVVDPQRRLTYAELDRRSAAIAAALLERGWEPGDRVLFQAGNRVETVEAWYGVLKAGLVPVCALPSHERHEIGALVASTSPKAQVVDADARHGQVLELALAMRDEEGSDRELIVIGGKEEHGETRLEDLAEGIPGSEQLDAVEAQLSPTDLAILQLSGGTTATPKAIPRLHAESWYNALATAQRFSIAPGERVAHVIPILHNAGLHSALHAGHSVGATVLLCGPDPDQFIPFLIAEKAESVILVPGLVSWLLEREDFRQLLKQLRRLSLSAAMPSPELLDSLEALGVNFVQQFGMGEGFCTGMEIDAPREMRRETVGYPLSSEDEFRVVDPEGGDVELGESGELWVCGPYTICGYWNSPERNAVAFSADGFYKTGDLVRERLIDGHRCVVVGGRLKDLINRGGEKVNAEEVENALLDHPAVRDVAVVAMPDPRLGERACACVVVRPGTSITLEDLTEFLAQRGLAKYKWPERLELLELLPRTQIGKVEKSVLRKQVAHTLCGQEESSDAGR